MAAQVLRDLQGSFAVPDHRILFNIYRLTYRLTPLCSHHLCTWCLLFATVRERLHRGVASNACCEALLSDNWLVQPCKIHDVHEMSFCI